MRVKLRLTRAREQARDWRRLARSAKGGTSGALRDTTYGGKKRHKKQGLTHRDTHDQEKTDRSRERDSESPSDSWISRKALVARLTPTASLATRVQQTQAREWLIKWSSMSECELLARLRGKELIRKRVRDSPLLSLRSLHSRSLGLARKQEAEHGSSGCDRSSHEATGDRRRENENERETTGERERRLQGRLNGAAAGKRVKWNERTRDVGLITPTAHTNT